MKKFYMNPSMDVKEFEAENIVTASGAEQAIEANDRVTAESAALNVDFANALQFNQ